MEGKVFNFSNFKSDKVNFSHYRNGNVKAEIISGDGMKSCEITTDLHISLKENLMMVRDTSFTEKFLHTFMNMGLIYFYKRYTINNTTMYLCGITYKRSAAYNRYYNPCIFAMA